MNKKIRKGVFETNSSSTHSICIAKEAELSIPRSLHFEFGEFGWEQSTLDSMYEKSTYLYTGLVANGRMEDVEKVKSMLSEAGIEVSFEEPVFETHTYTGSDGLPKEYTTCKNGGYVDHSDELSGFLNAVCADKGMLLRYLFSDLSFIITGNDNDESDVDIKVDYAYDEFYKGN